MKVSEAKKMIGQKVRFRKRYSGITDTGIIKTVKGKNVEVDVMGMTEWLWLPDVVITPAPVNPIDLHDLTLEQAVCILAAQLPENHTSQMETHD